MTERLAERRRTHRRRLLARAGAWLGAAAAVAGAAAVFFLSPLFALDASKVEVSGSSAQIDADAVVKVLDSHDGESLALLNVPHVADQLRDITGVRDVTVERVWPAGLRVTMLARHPVAALAEGDAFVLLDADAVRVGVVNQPPADVPVITIPEGDARVLAAVIEVVRNLPASVLSRVSGVGALTEDTVTFSLVDAPRVEWGSAQDSALKAQVLQVMLASPLTADAGVIDVSAPTMPVTRAS